MSYKCPKCNQSHHTNSLAALNYKETAFSNTNGNFSGSAIGTGGIMFGGGSYSSNTTTQSKRALKFDEPEEVESNSSFLIFLGFCAGMALLVSAGSILHPDNSFFSSFSIGSTPSSNASAPQKELFNIVDNYRTIVGGFAAFSAVLILFLYLKRAQEADNEANSYNNNMLPDFQDRYAQLHYCEKCHVIFDEKGNFESATEKGFSHMMSISQSDNNSACAG